MKTLLAADAPRHATRRLAPARARGNEDGVYLG